MNVSKTRFVKTCSCGLSFIAIPETAKYHASGDVFEGWYWDCVCRSTLFVPVRKIAMAVAA